MDFIKIKTTKIFLNRKQRNKEKKKMVTFIFLKWFFLLQVLFLIKQRKLSKNITNQFEMVTIT